MSAVDVSSNPILPLRVEGLELAYGDTPVQRDLAFDIQRGSVFAIMGPSGCGKSTLMKAMIGLHRPRAGRVLYGEIDFHGAEASVRARLMRHIGVLYQQGALLGDQTLAQNVSIPLREYTGFSPGEIREIAEMKLAMVGLPDVGGRLPSDISGGMRKRAALARAMALDPSILFLDEPSAGLDPISARQLDELILQVAGALDTTVVMVTHELASIFAVADDGVFLDADSGTMIGRGSPRELLAGDVPEVIREFLTRGESSPSSSSSSSSSSQPESSP